MMLGFDISNHQGIIDWNTVGKLGYSWCALKASEGTSFVDRCVARNVAGARRAGLAIAFYHFARPSTASGSAEANAFLNVIKPLLTLGDVLVLDSEDEDVAVNADLLAHHEDFVQTIEWATGSTPWLYSSAWYMLPHGVANSSLTRCGLWYAAYTPLPPDVQALGWSFWTAWQYTAAGVVPGIGYAVDLDTFNGTREQFRAYGVTRIPV